MNFKETLKTIAKRFNENSIDFALIGAFALLQSGIERATRDMDFMIFKKDIEKVKKIMFDLSYEVIQSTKTFSQFESPLRVFGNVDFLHVTGRVGGQMMLDAKKKTFLDTELKIVCLEDLIGLKVLAYANDQSREKKDMSDIQSLYEAYKNEKIKLDLEKIKRYYSMFEKMDDYQRQWMS